jgi:hypothetical protein
VETLTEGSLQQTEGSLQKLVATLIDQAKSHAKSILAEGNKSPEQASLLAALGLFLQNWPKSGVAESVGVDFGLLSALDDLKPGQYLILEGCFPHKFRLTVRPETEELKTKETLLCHWCPFPPPGYCCIKVLSPM